MIDCLTPLSPHPFSLYSADLFAWMSHLKYPRRLSLLICCVLVWQMGESKSSLCHNALWKLSYPLCSHTSGMFPFVQVPSDTQLWSCVIILADDFQDIILWNNLIAIWYSNSAHCLNLLRCFAWLLWCFLYSCWYIFTPSSSWYQWTENLIPHHHLFWGWFAEKTYSCIAVTYFAVFFCYWALQVLDSGFRFQILDPGFLHYHQHC